ncbi:alpha/beta fold hydrolase [Streptomyces sp. NPDC101455]|uniref:alpha/beta fold hydrolase n=1 Tax=Streptomyces sp. NPDC101455 TaxID=3366142 RepID=UPI0038278906
MTAFPHLSSLVTGPEGAPWITFVPGIGNDADFWKAQADALSAGRRCLRFDPWGCGDSDPPPTAFTIDDVADGVVQLWDELGITSSSVVGLGFGGSVALHLGLRHPPRVERVVACCCRPRQPDDRRDFWRDRQETARRDGLEELAELTVSRWLGIFGVKHPEVYQQLRDGFRNSSVDGYCGYVGAFIDMDLQVEKLAVTTLLVAAENDHGGGPVAAMRSLSETIHAPLEVIAGSGHIVTHEAAAELTGLLAGFL